MIQEQLSHLAAHMNGDEGDTTTEAQMHEYDVYIEPGRITFLKKEPKTIDVTQPASHNDAAQPLLSRSASSQLAAITISLYLILLLACLLFQLHMLLNPPTALVLIKPQEHTIITTATIQVHARLLQPLTLSQSLTVKATGHGHQDARSAHGSLTFYNGSLDQQTVPAGTMLTGADGVQIITDQNASIPAGAPPSYGQATVSAHANSVGSMGNIQAGDISVALSSDLLAKNLAAFTGGQSEREFFIVAKRDIASAAATLTSSLATIEGEALHTQLREGERTANPLCFEKVGSDHQAWEEATQVTVSVSETCTAVVYLAHDLYARATQMIRERAVSQLGSGYTLEGEPQVSITHAIITNQKQGIATVSAHITGTFLYQLTPGMRQQLAHLIAGKSKQQALRLLLQFPGIQSATIAITGNSASIPTNPGRITITVS